MMSSVILVLFNLSKKMKNAIIITGRMRNTHMTLQTFNDSIIIPNDADVFCFMEPNSTYDCEHFPFPNTRGDVLCDEDSRRFCEKILGPRLKSFEYSGHDYNTELVLAQQKCNENAAFFANVLKRIGATDAFHYFIEERVVNGGIVDQYLRVQRAIRKVVEFEKQNGFKYDCIIRSRFDRMNIIGTFNAQDAFEDVKRNKKESVSVGMETVFFEGIYPWYVDCFFFGTRDIMVEICENFIGRMGGFIDMTQEKALIQKSMSPEVQIALYVRELEKDGSVRFVRSRLPRCIKIPDDIKCRNCFIYNVFMVDC